AARTWTSRFVALPLGFVLAPDFADDELLASRYGQCLRHVAQQHFPVRVAFRAHVALEAADRIACHEAITMHAHEARTELLFQLGQGFLEQVFAIRGADRDVLELSLE